MQNIASSVARFLYFFFDFLAAAPAVSTPRPRATACPMQMTITAGSLVSRSTYCFDIWSGEWSPCATKQAKHICAIISNDTAFFVSRLAFSAVHASRQVRKMFLPCG